MRAGAGATRARLERRSRTRRSFRITRKCIFYLPLTVLLKLSKPIGPSLGSEFAAGPKKYSVSALSTAVPNRHPERSYLILECLQLELGSI